MFRGHQIVTAAAIAQQPSEMKAFKPGRSCGMNGECERSPGKTEARPRISEY